MGAITTHAAGITKGHGEVVLAMGLRTSVYDIWRRNGKKELKKLLVLHCNGEKESESTFQLLVKPPFMEAKTTNCGISALILRDSRQRETEIRRAK